MGDGVDDSDADDEQLRVRSAVLLSQLLGKRWQHPVASTTSTDLQVGLHHVHLNSVNECLQRHNNKHAPLH